jgi:hypothetical protein
MKFQVLRPFGEATAVAALSSPRLDGLAGKTICELSSNMYNAEISFPIIRELLRQRYPDIKKVIPYTEINKGLPDSTVMTYSGTIEEQEKKTEAAVAVAIQKGCDAIIVGNGG